MDTHTFQMCVDVFENFKIKNNNIKCVYVNTSGEKKKYIFSLLNTN